MGEITELKIIIGIAFAIYLSTAFFTYQILDDIKKENKELKEFFKEIFKNNFNLTTKHISDITKETDKKTKKNID